MTDNPHPQAGLLAVTQLPDPNDPAYEAARVEMLHRLYAIGAEDERNGYTEMADDLVCGDLMHVPTWIALGMIADARRHAALSQEAKAAADMKAAILAALDCYGFSSDTLLGRTIAKISPTLGDPDHA